MLFAADDDGVDADDACHCFTDDAAGAAAAVASSVVDTIDCAVPRRLLFNQLKVPSCLRSTLCSSIFVMMLTPAT